MSDPAKTPAEIEDVLASIRRLVSDHDSEGTDATQDVAELAQDAASPQAPEAAEAADDTSAERLVLTPSQRVSEADDPWAPVTETEQNATPDAAVEADVLDVLSRAPTQEEGSEIPSEIADESAWKPEDRLMDYHTVGAGGAHAEDEPFIEDTTQDHTADPAPSKAPEDDIASAEDVADLALLDGMAPEPSNFESETGDDNWPGDGAEAALLTLVARRDPVRAEPEAMPEPEDTPDAAGPEVAEESPPSDDLRSPVETDASDAEADAPEAELDIAESEMTQADAPIDMPEDSAQDGIESDPETPETAETRPADVPAAEPDSDAANAEANPIEKSVALASEASATKTATEADTDTDDAMRITPVFSRKRPRAEPPVQSDAAPEPQVETQAEPELASLAADEASDAVPSATIFDAEEGVLDEETLRDIIVDVVREELQGVLGQRITRNVRKMVRREIRLALAAEDLE
ncbi:hypothetical protein [Gymnodinialimonas ulvae]|uniref:hypothetical protein n=1 Tax=Gymnodinialimonas ulvae TaxID=3126504 RepID=UPI00309D7C8C